MLSTNRIPKRLRQEVLFLLLVHSLPQQCGGSCGHKRKYYILENGSEEKHGIVSEIVPSASTSQLLPAVGWKLSEKSDFSLHVGNLGIWRIHQRQKIYVL